jgi:hypothetical protein
MAKRTKFQIRSDAARQRWHVRDDQKEGYWRQHIAAWGKSGLSKRAYCTENDLAYSSFMTWSREIDLRDREKDPPANVAALLSNVEKGSNPFVPLRILSEKVPEEKESEAPPASDVKQQQLEIALPSGAVIRLHDGCDPSFVAKLLSCLKA